MKPSGPGLLFVGRLLITVSISVLVIGLLIFSISSWFSLERLYLFKIFFHFFQVVHFIRIELLVVVSYDPLYFCSDNCNFFFFISNLIDLSLLPFFLMCLAKGLPLLFVFSNKQLLVSLIFSIVFVCLFVSILFISALIFMISFLLLTLRFVCSFFSSCFRCKVRLFICDFSCFLR